MSVGGFHLSQFKITYNTTNYQSLYDYGTDLLSKYANCILTASQRSDGNWSIDSDKSSYADDTVNGIPIYNIQSRIPVWGTAYPEGSYNIGCFLKYDNGSIIRHLFLMLNSCVIYEQCSPGTNIEDKNSLPFYRITFDNSTRPFYSYLGGYPISIGAMVREEPFVTADLFDNSKTLFSVSDTPLFPINGSFIHSLGYTNDYDTNIPFNFKKLSTPNENDSYVFGVAVKESIVISIFRDSSWQIGNYTCSVYGDIIDCYNTSDNKRFGVIQGSCFYYTNWSTASSGIRYVYEQYDNQEYAQVIGNIKSQQRCVGLTKDYLYSVISSTTDATNFCGCTGNYLFFTDNLSNNINGSKYKGNVNTDVFRQCNSLTSSEVVLDGDFLRIGCCLVGWDSSNERLLD